MKKTRTTVNKLYQTRILSTPTDIYMYSLHLSLYLVNKPKRIKSSHPLLLVYDRPPCHLHEFVILILRLTSVVSKSVSVMCSTSQISLSSGVPSSYSGLIVNNASYVTYLLCLGRYEYRGGNAPESASSLPRVSARGAVVARGATYFTLSPCPYFRSLSVSFPCFSLFKVVY
jgi:hypothetical protein